jgi:N-ethylmaleimide reductase
VRLSPFSQYGGIHDGNSMELFTSVIEELNKYDLAYLHLIEGRGSEIGLGDELHADAINNARVFRPHYKGNLISAAAYTPATGQEALEFGYADAIAYGRLFISNPDLVDRIAHGASLNPYDRSSFYGGDERGYTDHPALGELVASKKP